MNTLLICVVTIQFIILIVIVFVDITPDTTQKLALVNVILTFIALCNLIYLSIRN